MSPASSNVVPLPSRSSFQDQLADFKVVESEKHLPNPRSAVEIQAAVKRKVKWEEGCGFGQRGASANRQIREASHLKCSSQRIVQTIVFRLETKKKNCLKKLKMDYVE